MSEKRWSASNYRTNKAKQRALKKPEWVTNPETGAEFCLRRVGAMASMIANFMPSIHHAVADTAVETWKKDGVEGSADGQAPKVMAEKIAEGERDLKMMARIVAEACVVPKLVVGATKEDELDPAEMADEDVLFIFRYATGQAGDLKGGGIANVADLTFHPQRLNRGPGTRTNGKKPRPTSEPISATG